MISGLPSPRAAAVSASNPASGLMQPLELGGWVCAGTIAWNSALAVADGWRLIAADALRHRGRTGDHQGSACRMQIGAEVVRGGAIIQPLKKGLRPPDQRQPPK